MDDMGLYQALALHLDEFPQGFPATKSGKELELLAYLFTPDEAQFATRLSLDYKVLDEVSETIGISSSEGRQLVKAMAKKGLINFRRGEEGFEVSLLPFVVGFFERQAGRMDANFARLFEDYYQEAAKDLFSIEPHFHRVIPVNETIDFGIEILPQDDIGVILSRKKAWAVVDCVCRTQKSLLGEGCDHPLRACLVMSDTPGVFDNIPQMEALDLPSALAVLKQAARAGLVHTIANQKKDISYICNCCTCSCGILRGIAEAGIANVVAKSAYYAVVDEPICVACGNCQLFCQFGAITIEDVALIDPVACVGCGICVANCPEDAIKLFHRDLNEIQPVPDTEGDWLSRRAEWRKGI